MRTYPTVLSIAGSDSCGGAGVQADMKTCSALGVYAMTAITAITAQCTTGVDGIMGVTPEIVGKQIDTVCGDIRPDAVKIGMLFSKEIVDVVAEKLQKWNIANVVLDPVMISTSGSRLISEDAIESLITKLMPLASIVTPNRHEAALMAGMDLDSLDSIKEAARRILAKGAKAVLIKGGHFDDEQMTDYLFTADGNEPVTFKSRLIDTPNTHGTGCTLSSAIASYLALGSPLEVAVAKGKAYLTNALIAGSMNTLGKGHGPVNHLFGPKAMEIKIN